MGNIRLPNDWEKAKLKDITEIITKGTTPTTIGYNYTNEGVNFVKIESITNNGKFLIDKMAHISEECNNKMLRSQLKENDIVFSIAGAIGRTAMVSKEILPANTNQALSIIRLNTNEVSTEFLLKYLRSEDICKQFEKKKQGVAQLNLSLKDISELEIMYPSILEQKRIVTMLNRAQKAIDMRKEAIRLLDELIKSQFIEMFGDLISNNYNWKIVKLKDICALKSGGTPTRNKPEYFKGNIPWITTVALGKNLINEKDAVEFITQEAIDNSATKLIQEGSLLFGMRVGVGKISVNSIPMCTNQDIMAITEIDAAKYNLMFLKKVIEAYSEYFNNQKRGATIQGIKSDTLKEINIPIVDLKIQNQFIKFVTQVDKLKFEMQKSLEEMGNNFNSLMQRAFKGELFN